MRDLAAWVQTERQTTRQQARGQAHLEAKIDRLEGELEPLQRDRGEFRSRWSGDYSRLVIHE